MISDENILAILSDLIQEIDYDIWKNYFVDPDEDMQECLEDLVIITKRYLDNE